MLRVVLAIGRTSGWTSQWLDMIEDRTPRQIDPGRHQLYYVPIAQRW